jgi:cysteinyl-tRNA synthetase
LSNALKTLKSLAHNGTETKNDALETEIRDQIKACFLTMSDDFNTAKNLAVLFEMSARINDFKSGNTSISSIGKDTFDEFKNTYIGFMQDVLGLQEESTQNEQLINNVIGVLIDLRKKARVDKNYALSDRIRDDLKKVGVNLMDGKDGEMNYVIEQ